MASRGRRPGLLCWFLPLGLPALLLLVHWTESEPLRPLWGVPSAAQEPQPGLLLLGVRGGRWKDPPSAGTGHGRLVLGRARPLWARVLRTGSWGCRAPVRPVRQSRSPTPDSGKRRALLQDRGGSPVLYLGGKGPGLRFTWEATPHALHAGPRWRTRGGPGACGVLVETAGLRGWGGDSGAYLTSRGARRGSAWGPDDVAALSARQEGGAQGCHSAVTPSSTFWARVRVLGSEEAPPKPRGGDLLQHLRMRVSAVLAPMPDGTKFRQTFLIHCHPSEPGRVGGFSGGHWLSLWATPADQRLDLETQ